MSGTIAQILAPNRGAKSGDLRCAFTEHFAGQRSALPMGGQGL